MCNRECDRKEKTSVTPTRRRILFVIGSLGTGGAEHQMVTLAEGLAARGWSACVFCLETGGPLQERLVRARIGIVPGGYDSRARRVRKIQGLVCAQLRLLRLAAHQRPDVMHAFLPLTNLMGAIAGYCVRIPKIVTSRRALGTHQDRHPLWAPFDRLANRLSDVITVNSRAVAEDTIRRDRVDENKLELIHNGIDTTPFRHDPLRRETMRTRLGLEPGTVGIACVANLIPYKGHRELIEAFARVGSNHPSACLFLIGEDRGIGKGLVALADQLGVSERVILLGRREDVPALLDALDVGVLPSHEEGFSNALLELLAAGLPVVATAVGGNPEALADMPDCHLVPPRDPDALADALAAVVTHIWERRHTADARRKLVERRYSVASMIEAHEALYQSVPIH
jgi:glycosyltransferase involved in cell wall biosynthesis